MTSGAFADHEESRCYDLEESGTSVRALDRYAREK